MSTKQKLWIAGIVLAVAGVAVARLVAQAFDSAYLQLGFFLLGVLIAIAGLGAIMFGMKK